jgi:hypothetical protein
MQADAAPALEAKLNKVAWGLSAAVLLHPCTAALFAQLEHEDSLLVALAHRGCS